MNLIDEAVIIELFGIRVYAFGACVMLGTVCAMIVTGVMCRAYRMKKGAAPLIGLMSMVFGIVVSRLAFCLMNQELGQMMPLHVWPWVAAGGWSMSGLIAGVILSGFVSARILKEKPGKVLDILTLAVLPVIIAERFGERWIEDFDISRPLDSAFLAKSFLATGTDDPCLATYYVAAAVSLALFIILLFRTGKKEQDGRIAVSFLLLFGASSVVLESLRYDRFLSISFVGLQQVLAAVMLAAGVILAVKMSRRRGTAEAIAALVSLPLMVGIVLGLEFALDRTTWNKILLYTCMIITVAAPAALGLRLLSNAGKGNANP